MCMMVCSGFYSYFFSLLSVFYSIGFRNIAFSLTRSDISAGNSFSVPQYTPLSYTDVCFLCVYCCLLKINHDDDA